MSPRISLKKPPVTTSDQPTMAKHRKPKKRKHGGAIPSTEAQAEQALTTLREAISRLGEADSAEAGPLWGDIQHALMKTKADRQTMMRIITSRDIDTLHALVEALEHGNTDIALEPPDSEPADEDRQAIDPEILRHAMRAFRKRLKLARLDDESRISVSPMTGGRQSRIEAILAPREYPEEIWRALVREGRLKDVGQGFFEDAEEGGAA